MPQRIRAGCDILASNKLTNFRFFATAHSRGLRPQPAFCFWGRGSLCHSAFARVATCSAISTSFCGLSFATAHSRGLRRRQQPQCGGQSTLPQRIRAGCDDCIRTHGFNYGALPQRIRAGCDGCGLCVRIYPFTLPQRIRAGCDCGKAMQRTANLLREGR